METCIPIHERGACRRELNPTQFRRGPRTCMHRPLWRDRSARARARSSAVERVAKPRGIRDPCALARRHRDRRVELPGLQSRLSSRPMITTTKDSFSSTRARARARIHFRYDTRTRTRGIVQGQIGDGRSLDALCAFFFRRRGGGFIAI